MNTQKSIGALIIGIVSFMVSQVTTVMLLAFAFIVLDYISGMIAAVAQGVKIEKRVAIMGILKKIGYGLLWFVAMSLDLIIKEQTARIGIDLGNAYFTLATTIYILGTEGSSILQNVLLWGTSAPDWLLKPFSLMRDESGNIIRNAKK